MSEPVRSIWYDVQAEQGAEFEDFDGWLWTATFGDPLAEYEAVRSAAGMWDVYPLVKLDFTGPDALRAAQRAFTNDVTSMNEGQVRYGAFVGEGGTMVDDGTVYKLAEIAEAPPNRFVTLRYEADTLPEYGATVTKDGAEVGVLTSPTESPLFGKIGMAVIRADLSSPGTAVEVALGDGTTPATVDVLPIYDTNKERPRA